MAPGPMSRAFAQDGGGASTFVVRARAVREEGAR
ncbi:hypothetical protein BSFP_023450 [Burkholderia stabilis]|uniref:Uncharacterized protein n=1 Tax=Burkholderia stabilis TaxID=95485 RepID=A0A1Y1BMK5_9BURK|nr:hypothetical protein BSFP_023450 [Burkholderia stabilis]